MPKERVGILEKYEVSKGGARESTPGFNVPPLLAPTGTTEEQEATVNEIQNLIKRLKRPPRSDGTATQLSTFDTITGKCVSGWEPKADAIKKCLSTACEILAQQLSKAMGDDHSAVSPLQELLRRAQLLTCESLRERLFAFIRQTLVNGSGADTEGLFPLLFTKESIVLLELADWGDGVPANHESVWQAVNRVLLFGRATSTIPPTTAPANGIDAFGKQYEPTQEKMPERKLPRLGNVKLRSNSASKPCQTRYGLVEGQSFPVTLLGRAEYANALAWLTDEDREGQTYRDISNSCGFELPALLLAYPDPLPATRAPALAAVLAKTNQTGPLSVDVRFVAAAELLIRQLDELRREAPSAKITIFVLAKRDTARTKLLLSLQFTAERIVDAVHDWREAAANIPPIFVRRFGEDKNTHWCLCDDIPYPSEVARCLNRVWQRGGERVEKVAVFDFGSALTLLLDEGRLPTEIAATGLRFAVTQWIDLLLAMGQAATLERAFTFSEDVQTLLPPILGLLLFKLGYQKEVYMNALPYWLGRLMATADKLHRNYCERERDGKIPKGPLIGNAAMSACLENPQAGLARLSERITLYQQVAGVDLSKELAEIVQHIDADKLPKRANDEDKAQMLLGYLARPDLILPPESPTPTESNS